MVQREQRKPDERRLENLNRYFYMILEGTSKIKSPQDGARFLEAICNRHDKSDCIERLASSTNGQGALHSALVQNANAKFFDNGLTPLIKFLSDPMVRRLCNGELLNKILMVMVEPPTFFKAFARAVRLKTMSSTAEESFLWLLLQLVLLPSQDSGPFRLEAQAMLDEKLWERSGSTMANSLSQKIKAIIQPSLEMAHTDIIGHSGPGGRHDNDFVNYHDIAILPTRAELSCTERPFLRLASSIQNVEEPGRAHIHLDNQFRLLREDMLDELREGLKISLNDKRKGGKRNMVVKGLIFDDITNLTDPYSRPAALVLKSPKQIPDIIGATEQDRKATLKRNPDLIRHGSFGCLVGNRKILTFVTIDRNEEKLAKELPQLCVCITDRDSIRSVLSELRSAPVDLHFVSTPMFAYEPILQRLQSKADIELAEEILRNVEKRSKSPFRPKDVIQRLKLSGASNVSVDSKDVLNTTSKVKLDPSQISAIVDGLKYKVPLIQGPPGTGKSLVGALLAKTLLENTDKAILVLAYTNHALDQFLEDLINIGISMDLMVRLGSKSTSTTASLLLSNQMIGRYYVPKTRWELINSKKSIMADISDEIDTCLTEYQRNGAAFEAVLEYLEFSSEDSHFFDALSIPATNGDMTLVGNKGKKMKPDWLIRRWAFGNHAGFLSEAVSKNDPRGVWYMTIDSRRQKLKQWEQEIHLKLVSNLAEKLYCFNKEQKMYQSLRKGQNEEILKRKRVIACTTTAASKYAREIQAAGPGIIIVEEAGEIKECDIIAAMGPSTEQIIQIGDHKQLRPKVKNYNLTVEKGSGYDLNRSMFERLILQGKPHTTLLTQHRMRIEISALIEHTYPGLKNADGTDKRPDLLGFQDNIVFFNHKFPETDQARVADGLDQGAKSSKQNQFEAQMVLKIIRYLAQQGYKTKDITILTPYLGQLCLIRDMLRKEHDPVLSDIDSHELIAAGLIPAASAEVKKNPIRLSTIDNYQGEESDIIIVSLTRSNENGDIGFMNAPERLNVLISRARDALIMIGCAETFLKAKKGSEEWECLFGNLKEKGHIYDGFPLACQKHPDTRVIVRDDDGFDKYCPDGGCSLPWYAPKP